MRVLFIAMLLVACGSPEPTKAPTTPAPPTPPSPSTPVATSSAPPEPAPDALDLSSPEASKRTMIEVLKRGDKEAFKRCVTRRILERRLTHNDFDAWFEVWRSAATDNPSSFSKIRLGEEDGKWKLDEN